MTVGEHPRDLVCQVLSVKPDEIISMEPVLPASRNHVWRLRIGGRKADLFLKIQRDASTSASVLDEAESLLTLQRQLPHVPTLITFGRGDSSGLPFLLTEELPGLPLSRTLGDEAPNLPRLFKQVGGWLQELQNQDGLRKLLEKRVPRSFGRFVPTFDPVGSARDLCRKFRGITPTPTLCEYEDFLSEIAHTPLAIPGTEIVQGSLSTENILNSGWLTGILDYEGTRLGSLMFDVANLTVNLIDDNQMEAAHIWIKVCAELFGEKRIRFEAKPFLIDLLLMRRCSSIDHDPASKEDTAVQTELPRFSCLP